MNNTFTFCPMCQLPLKAVNILPDVHVAQCMSIINEDSPFNVSECQNGIHCLSTDLFHYRDFSHKLLAAYRSSAAYVPPDVDIQPTPKKKKITPGRSSRKQKTPVKLCLQNNCTIQSDSDSEIFVPLKTPCRKLLSNENSEFIGSKDESKSIHNKKNILLEEPQIIRPIYTKDSEIHRNTDDDDDCDVMIVDSERITDNKCTDKNYSSEVKCNKLEPSKLTNVALGSTNDKLSENKLHQINKTTGLSKEAVQKDSDKNVSEVIIFQDASQLKSNKNVSHNKAIIAENELEYKFLDSKTVCLDKNKSKLSQTIDMSKTISEDKCFERTHFESNKNPELNQQIDSQKSSNKKLSQIMPLRQKKDQEFEKTKNAQDDSEDEVFNTKSNKKKSLKRSQTTRSKLEKNPEDKCSETRSSPRIKNQRLANQNNKEKSSDKELSDGPEKGLEHNQAPRPQGALEDEHLDPVTDQVKKKLKLNHPIDVSKLSSSNKCFKTNPSSDDILPRRISGRSKKKLELNRTIISEKESKDANVNKDKKSLRTIQKTNVSKISPEKKNSEKRCSQRKKVQKLEQINKQRSPERRLSRRMSSCLRKEIEHNQAIDAQSDLQDECSTTKSDRVQEKEMVDTKTDLDEKCSERSSQLQKDQEHTQEIYRLNSPDKKVSRRMLGLPRKELEDNQAIEAQYVMEDECSVTKCNQQSSDTKNVLDEKLSKIRCTQHKQNLKNNQLMIKKGSDTKILKKKPGRPKKKEHEFNNTVGIQDDSEDECFDLSLDQIKKKLKVNKLINVVQSRPNDEKWFEIQSNLCNENNKLNQVTKVQKSSCTNLLETIPSKVNEKLNHNEAVDRVNYSEDSKTDVDQVQNNFKSNKQCSAQKGSDEKYILKKSNQEKENLANNPINDQLEIITNNENCQTEEIIMDLPNQSLVNKRNNDLITNVEFNSLESLRINTEEYSSPNDLMHNNNQLDCSKQDVIDTAKSVDVTLKGASFTTRQLGTNLSTSIDSQVTLKPLKCVLERLELGGEKLKYSKSSNKPPEQEKNTIEYKNMIDLDFDDIIPGSMLDKELLRNLERTLSNSPTSIHTYISDYNASASISSGPYSSDVDDEIGTNVDDAPSSPEMVQPRINKHRNLFISSSSDSDVPLASLVQNKPAEKSKENNENWRSNSARQLRSFKTPPTYNNCQVLSGSEMSPDSDIDSGKSTASKNSSTVSIVQGKEVAGKILRTPKKSMGCLDSKLIKSNSNGKFTAHSNKDCSDKDSDSGKSSGSKDLSFVPSERESSTHPSDSAFSAESTENLTSTTSSTYTSSEDFSSDNKSSDPSYSADSENLKLITKHRKRRNNEIGLSPKKYKELSQSLSGESSDISQKEKMLFRKKIKSSPVKLETYPQQDKQNENIYKSYECPAKKEWQTVLSKMRSSCFPSDLKIDSEDSLTVASSCSSSDTSRGSMTLPLRQCPFYKKIPDTPFAVDAFQHWNIPGVKVYFLSHFHSDHYIGLKKSFSKPIYCSRITANLVRMQLRVEEKWLRILELNEPQAICGVEVTALDANHCPGSMMFLFSLTNGQNYLHVGDFRGCKAMMKYPALQRITIAKLFLDTTYCSPQYCFPTQEEVIRNVIDIVKEQVKTKPRTLVVCGSYTIGKEKVFLGIAEALDWHVWARPNKQRVFACLNDPRINSRLSQDPRNANVHVLPMASIQITPLQQHLQSCSGAFTHVLGFKPTGWELSGKSRGFKVTSKDNITVYGVPYSEHSSFTELRDFVQFLEPREVVPTVNVSNAASRNKMSKHFSEWLRPQTSKDLPTKSQSKISQFFK